MRGDVPGAHPCRHIPGHDATAVGARVPQSWSKNNAFESEPGRWRHLAHQALSQADILPHRKAVGADEARLTPSAFRLLRTSSPVLSRAMDVASNQLVDGRGTKAAFPAAAAGLVSQVTPPNRRQERLA